MKKILVGTRGSALAQWQTHFIIDALKRVAPGLDVETHIIKTQGDKDQVRPLAELGGLGVFTRAIEDELLAHRIDLAVHSLKDLPTEVAQGLAIAAIPARQDPRDCLVSKHSVALQQLPSGSKIGTSSARRAAQILALRPDLSIVPMRGNVDTRLRHAASDQYDAVVLAAAGITRLDRASEITEYLTFDQVLPDPGQGALAVEIRSDDEELAALVKQLDDLPTRLAVTAERAFLRSLGGGCRMPIGAMAEIKGQNLILQGLVASSDGKQIVRGKLSANAEHAEALGAQLAIQLLVAGANRLVDFDPLHGKRIIVTRARDQASELSAKIRALGGEPVEYPAIGFAPLDDFSGMDEAFRQSREFDWVVFTSANGVRFVSMRLMELGQSLQIFSTSKVAAIGPATAGALEEQGLHVDLIPTRFLGEQIAAELPALPGQNVLLLRADLASETLARGLIARGFAVRDVDAYRTIKPPAPAVDLQKVDAVTFTSSSTVRHFTEMLNGNQSQFEQAAVFCIGPVTAETARALGWHVTAEGAEHTIDGLLAAMIMSYTNSREQDKEPDHA